MQQITNENIKEILSFINPAVLSYQEWINIGMALKDEGIDCSVWDEWSQNDSRYHAGECERKWKTFIQRFIICGHYCNRYANGV